ncbi:MAG: hypothetical protein V2A53_04690 [bacterium]
MMVVSIKLLIKNPLSIFYLSRILSNTGSYKSILQPAIWSFNLAFDLRR